jgi:hypothetical protein
MRQRLLRALRPHHLAPVCRKVEEPAERITACLECSPLSEKSGRLAQSSIFEVREVFARCDVKRGLRQLPWRRPRLFVGSTRLWPLM